jgi:hypothetical protein
MTGSMMDSILGMVTPDMRQALASRLGESPEGVQSGLGAATAATLSGLARKAAADGAFLGQIVGLLEGSAGQRVIASLPSIASSGSTDSTGDVINRLVPMVFGAQQGEVASAISQHAGLNAGCGLGLLRVTNSLVLAYFAKVRSSGSLTVSSLANMLRAETPTLHGYLPASLLPGAPDVVTSIFVARTRPRSAVVRASRHRRHAAARVALNPLVERPPATDARSAA